jgi:thiopeptide-type bacteriocin biosynthesis protein
VSGRLVLARARWRLAGADLQAIGRTQDATQYAAVQAWRAERRLPRYVALADGDNELVIDFDNVLSVAALAHQLRGRRSAVLVELFPGPDELCVTGPEGRFVHELVVPFLTGAVPNSVGNSAAPRTASSVRRRFPPGSEWLYAKLYAGTATADQMLGRLAPVVESSLACGAADRWFFIRYGDPDWHLRIRFHGAPERLHDDVLPRLEVAVAPLLETGEMWRMQLDTYEREVERYGGDPAIELAEHVFSADSDAALAIVRSLSGDAGLDLRWRLALCGIDLLFDDLGFTLEEKRFVARQARESYGREFGADGNLKGELSRRYRKERAGLEMLFDRSQDPPAELAPGLEALRRRTLRLAPVAAELRGLAQAGRLGGTMPDVARSYAHMHVNRLLRSAQRAQEFVLYELLDRFYSMQAARGLRSR